MKRGCVLWLRIHPSHMRHVLLWPVMIHEVCKGGLWVTSHDREAVNYDIPQFYISGDRASSIWKLFTIVVLKLERSKCLSVLLRSYYFV